MHSKNARRQALHAEAVLSLCDLQTRVCQIPELIENWRTKLIDAGCLAGALCDLAAEARRAADCVAAFATNSPGLEPGQLLDACYPAQEQIPRLISASFVADGTTIHLQVDGTVVGDPLADRAVVPDGYRFHDALHFGHAAVLGWSPVLRGLLGRRRRSVPEIDRREDGGRAKMIEEAICHVIYDHGRSGGEVHDAERIDIGLVRYVRRLAQGLEVECLGDREWAHAISAGYRAFDALRTEGGGRLHADLTRRSLRFAES